MPDKLSRMGIAPDPATGHLVVVYLDDAGQKQTLDLTVEMHRIAEERAKWHIDAHQRDYHGA